MTLDEYLNRTAVNHDTSKNTKNALYGFKFKIEGLYFNTFRKPLSNSLILTYSIPSFTVIRGLISNALGLERDDLTVQDWGIKIGIIPIDFKNKSKELAKILKLKGDGKSYFKNYSSSPMFKEFLVNPSYEIYIIGEKEKIECINNALLNPQRPLYLGSSDELCDLEVSEIVEVEISESSELNCVVEGLYENCTVERIPYKLIKKDKSGKKWDSIFKTVSIPLSNIKLNDKLQCFKIGNKCILAY
ncbi:CRISPR-associated protein Cas5 [Methanothermococcus thermolithotrophicus]|jgi:CRISPR-associated protein Cas5h|uniref:CRISPR-associated protein Cas5 n=1 Tax=Methanothermococcus thermolithotrophicus TaxID=2186 RepID=UPI00037271A5|nr:CRISPR-associated protein Cas5 [Methanothermococcus thermolithotrophicus]